MGVGEAKLDVRSIRCSIFFVRCFNLKHSRVNNVIRTRMKLSVINAAPINMWSRVITKLNAEILGAII